MINRQKKKIAVLENRSGATVVASRVVTNQRTQHTSHIQYEGVLANKKERKV